MLLSNPGGGARGGEASAVPLYAERGFGCPNANEDPGGGGVDEAMPGPSHGSGCPMVDLSRTGGVAGRCSMDEDTLTSGPSRPPSGQSKLPGMSKSRSTLLSC